MFSSLRSLAGVELINYRDLAVHALPPGFTHLERRRVMFAQVVTRSSYLCAHMLPSFALGTDPTFLNYFRSSKDVSVS